MQRIAYISFYLLLISCDLIDEDPPGAPFGLKGYFTMTNDQARIHLSWEKPPSDDIDEYHIFRSMDQGMSFEILDKVSYPVHDYEDTSIVWLENIYYKIRAIDQSTNVGNFSDSIFIFCYKPSGNWEVQDHDSLFLCIDPTSYSTPEMFRLVLDQPLVSIGDTAGIMDFPEMILDTNYWISTGWMYYTYSVLEVSEDSTSYDTVTYANTVAPEYCTIVLSDPEGGSITFDSENYDTIVLKHTQTACNGDSLFP